jgi:hypothetical protein
MKRHIQNSGLKKWFGNYFVELESEPLKAIDQWASAYEGCIVSGGALSLISGTTYNVAAAMVVLKIDGEYKVAPLPATDSVDVSVQKAIRLKKTSITGQYQNPTDLIIAYDYSAEIINYTAGLGTLNQDYLLIPTNGGAIRAYTDVLKEALTVVTAASKGLMSAADKNKLDGVAVNANNYLHPAAHVASMITESTTRRFVSDAEKATWNSKAAGTHGHAASEITESTTRRFVSDAEKTTWNSKAAGTHGHAASEIAESTTRRFVSDAEKLGFWSGSTSELSVSKRIKVTAPSNQLNGIVLTGSNPVVTTASTNYRIAQYVAAPAASIASGVTDSGYKIGMRISTTMTGNSFLGTLNTNIGLEIHHGHYTGAGTGTVNNDYGLKLTGMSSGSATITNCYGIHQSGAQKNYFEKDIGIGVINPTEKLDVNGNIKNSGTITTTDVIII